MNDDIVQSLSDAIRIIDMYLDESSYDQAIDYAVRTKEKYEPLFTENHPQMLLLYMKTGSCYAGKELFNEALQAFMKGLEIRRGLTESDITEAEIIVGIGKCYYNLDLDEEAMEWTMKGLDMYHEDPSPDPGKLGVAYGAVADILNSQANYEEAIEWYLKTIAHNDKTYGRKNEYNAMLFLNLSKAYRYNRQFAKGLAAAQKALAILEKQSVKDITEIVVCQSSIGILFEESGQSAKATEYLNKVKATYEKETNLIRSVKAILAIDLGNLYLLKKDMQQATVWFLKAAAINEKEYGKDSIHITFIAQNLGMIYELQKNYSGALKWYERLLNAQIKHYGPDEIQTSESLTKTANCRTLMGDIEKAQEELERVIAIQTKFYGEEINHKIMPAYSYLARNYYSQKQYDLAEKFYIKALKTIESAGDKLNYPVYIESLHGLIQVYSGSRQFEKALITAERLLVLNRKLHGNENYATLMAVCEGAKIYTAMSNYSKALNVFLEALKCSIRRYGLEHHNTQAIFSELAVTYELADMPMSLNSWVMSRIKDMPITSMKKHRKR